MPRRRYSYRCLLCGEDFSTDRRRIRFCSDGCALRMSVRLARLDALEGASHELFALGGPSPDVAIRRLRDALRDLGRRYPPLPGLEGDPFRHDD